MTPPTHRRKDVPAIAHRIPSLPGYGVRALVPRQIRSIRHTVADAVISASRRRQLACTDLSYAMPRSNMRRFWQQGRHFKLMASIRLRIQMVSRRRNVGIIQWRRWKARQALTPDSQLTVATAKEKNASKQISSFLQPSGGCRSTFYQAGDGRDSS